ncbi:MAG: NAD(P)/FAD-dependent oxidoreductase [Chloroflexia bacterium]|nr:NAD(P)/FAD-dependent oxidoreductase [Chloroflexia bacterium]
MPRERDVEAIVVGGGPAGSTVATALAGAGHRVLLLDKAQFPRHKACSEYINPAGARLLDELGMSHEIRRAGAHRMEAMVVCAPDGRRFTVNFAQAEPGRTALGLSRYRFDHLLLERAKAAGVVVDERAHVREIMRENGHVVGVVATIGGTRECIRASLVIGADGHHSAVSRALGLDVSYRWPRKTGLVAHYRGVAGLDLFGEMHVAHHAYVGLAPLENGVTNVAVVTNVRAVEARTGSIEEFFNEAVRSIPAVARRLDGADRIGGIRGVGPMARRARRTTGDGYLLVGDAASFLDPFIGDGIYEALRGAQLAAPVASRALKAGDTTADALEPYRIECQRAFTAKRQVCWIVQGFISAPPLMNYVTERLSRREELGLTLSGVIGNLRPAADALSPIFLARLLRP